MRRSKPRPHATRPVPPPPVEESPYAPFDTPEKMADEVMRRRDRFIPRLKNLNPRPFIPNGWASGVLYPHRVEFVPKNGMEMIPFQVLFRAGRVYGPAAPVQAWLEARFGDDLARGQVDSVNNRNPRVCFEATTMVPLGAVDALAIWVRTLDEMMSRTCGFLQYYHGFLPESMLEDVWSISRPLGKLLCENPQRAAAEILRRRQSDFYGVALVAANAIRDGRINLEVIRRLIRDPRAPAFRTILICRTIKAWSWLGRYQEAIELARRALAATSDEDDDASFRTWIANCSGRLGRWLDAYQAVEKIPIKLTPRAAYHRAFSLLHLGKREEAKKELAAYHEAAGMDLYADLRFRAFSKRIQHLHYRPVVSKPPIRCLRPG